MEKKKISLKEIGLSKLIMVFVVGILIIILSIPGIFTSKDRTEKKSVDNHKEAVQNDMNTTSYDTNTYITEMENKLKNILKKVSGIGEVDVMITLKATKQQVPLKDDPSTQESVNEVDGEGGSRTNNSITREESTVLYTDKNGNLAPYIIQEIEPEIEGVLVIAEGGDDAKIIWDISEAVQALFGIDANKVKVMKMRTD